MIDYFEGKLKCPPGKVTTAYFEVERVIARPESTAQHPVIVTFNSARLRDEIKSLGKNLGGQVKKEVARPAQEY